MHTYVAIHIIIAPHVAMYIDKVVAKDAGTYEQTFVKVFLEHLH